jgi:hypothetical protein
MRFKLPAPRFQSNWTWVFVLVLIAALLGTALWLNNG